MALGDALTGVRVVAFEQAVAMPFCSFILAELGAEVIKIERRGDGDTIRGWDAVASGLSSGFVWLNAGKRDFAVDLRQPAGRDIVRALAGTADVFVENAAPGVAARLGLAADELRRHRPQLIYCSLSGYGQDGPYRDRKAYDLLVQGEAGILLSNGHPDAPAKVGLPITDLIAGSNAALAVVTALLARSTTGDGCYLDIAMLESAVPWLGYFPHRWWHERAEPPRTGMRHQFLCPYGPYRTADEQYVNLVVASAEHWERFCRLVVDRPGWLADARTATIDARRRNRVLVDGLVEAVTTTRPLAFWLDRLRAARLPYGEVRTIGSVVEHPQLLARRLFVQADSPVGPLPVVRFPLADPDRPRRIPALGEHTDALLAELGYGAERRDRLRRDGVI